MSDCSGKMKWKTMSGGSQCCWLRPIPTLHPPPATAPHPLHKQPDKAPLLHSQSRQGKKTEQLKPRLYQGRENHKISACNPSSAKPVCWVPFQKQSWPDLGGKMPVVVTTPSWKQKTRYSSKHLIAELGTQFIPLYKITKPKCCR